MHIIQTRGNQQLMKREKKMKEEQDKIKKQNIKWLIDDLTKYSKLYN